MVYGTFLLLVIVAVAWAALGLLFIWLRSRAFGKRKLFAIAAGSANSGAAYAFTVGMMPWAKESVRENLPSYAMGIAYHVGIFCAFALLAYYIVYDLFYQIDLAEKFFMFDFFGLAVGAIGGISLFVKRLLNPVLRDISCPDDYISNILATVFIALAVATIASPEVCRLWVTRIWLLSAIALFTYIPFSKMRHCIFFFSTRYHLGAFFGRRGCMPPAK
jgi:nitrate reductase gamma subunit